MNRLLILMLSAVVGVSIAGCDPFENDRTEQAEKARIECLDKFCDGDVEPKRDMATAVALKLNGQWYVGPKEYFSSVGRGGFEWWKHKPVSAGTKRPAEMQALAIDGKGYDFSIEIFLTGRQRWPEPNAPRPWEGGGWEKRFDELQKQGLRIERQQIRPELERVRFFDAQGKQYRHEYFLATQRRMSRGKGLPGVACDLYPDPRPNALPRCTGGMFWQEDVYSDFRFHAQHAADWPAIHQEIVRVLNLARKVQP